MSGVYGSILSAFSEQFQPVTYFDMAPLVGAGWGPRTDITVISAAVMQCKEGRKVKNSNSNLVTTRGMELWTEELLVAGRFIDDGEYVYRIAGDNEWRKEAGFTVYALSKVVASDGTEVTEPAFANGEGDFA
jgi:hypothetical protein